MGRSKLWILLDRRAARDATDVRTIDADVLEFASRHAAKLVHGLAEIDPVGEGAWQRS